MCLCTSPGRRGLLVAWPTAPPRDRRALPRAGSGGSLAELRPHQGLLGPFLLFLELGELAF